MLEQKTSLDIREAGAGGQRINRRLYCQLQLFSECCDIKPLVEVLQGRGIEGVLYQDINDPKGVGLLILTEDPNLFVREFRNLLLCEPFASLHRRPEMVMFGRTYSSGREPDLEDWLLKKPRRTVLNPDWPWAVWYPLRRKSEFSLLPLEEQAKILYEHAQVGMAYGEAGYVHDIRLACYGLDPNDNEFVIGLVGPELYPLSRIVQDMRKTQQTAKYIQSLGPFFVGKACWKSSLT